MDKNKTPRERAMEEILASRAETLDKELKLSATGAHPEVEFEPAPVDTPVEPPAETPAETPPVVEPAEELPIAAESPAPEAPKYVTVKIDGEEMQVPKEEVDKAGSVNIYQMEKAMQKRLKETNELHAAAKKQFQEIQKPVEPQPNQDEVIRKKVETLRFGTDDEAANVFKEMQKQPTIPVDAIVDTVSKRLEWKSAVQEFAKNHSDLLQDPDIQAIALARESALTNQMQATGRWPTDINKFYKDLGSDLRTKYGKPAAVDTKSRLDKKEALAEPKTASGRVPSAPEVKPKTVSEIIDEQRKARHQTSMR
jgi:hypothetical protein